MAAAHTHTFRWWHKQQAQRTLLLSEPHTQLWSKWTIILNSALRSLHCVFARSLATHNPFVLVALEAKLCFFMPRTELYWVIFHFVCWHLIIPIANFTALLARCMSTSQSQPALGTYRFAFRASSFFRPLLACSICIFRAIPFFCTKWIPSHCSMSLFTLIQMTFFFLVISVFISYFAFHAQAFFSSYFLIVLRWWNCNCVALNLFLMHTIWTNEEPENERKKIENVNKGKKKIQSI